MTETSTELQAFAAATENGALIDALSDQRRDLVVVDTGVPNFQAFIDDDGKVITVDTRPDVERRQVGPDHASGTTVTHGLDDMRALAVKWYAEPENRSEFVTYCDETTMTFTTVLDDSDDGNPGWRGHRLTYRLEHTPAMKAWLANDRRLLDQTDFAEHIENRLRDVIRPDAADLLEIAQTMSATGSIEFRSGSRLQDGRTQLKYVEETDAIGGHDGTLEIPHRFALSIPPFVGTLNQEIEARFRWRMKSGVLTLGYLLDDVEELTRQAFDQLVNELDSNVDWLVVRAVAPDPRR